MLKWVVSLVFILEFCLAAAEVSADLKTKQRKVGRNKTDRSAGRIWLDDIENLTRENEVEPNETVLAARSVQESEHRLRASLFRYQLSLQADKPELYRNLTELPANMTVGDASALFRQAISNVESSIRPTPPGETSAAVSDITTKVNLANCTHHRAVLSNRSSAHADEIQSSGNESRNYVNNSVNNVTTDISTVAVTTENGTKCQNVVSSNGTVIRISERTKKIIDKFEVPKEMRNAYAKEKREATKGKPSAEEYLQEVQKERRLLNKLSRRIDFHRTKVDDYEREDLNGSVTMEAGTLGIGFHRQEITNLRSMYTLHKARRNELLRYINQSRIQDDIKGEGRFDVSGLSRVEILGIPENKDENLLEITKRVGAVIKADISGIKKVYRGLSSSEEKPVVVLLKTQSFKRYWLIQGRAHRRIRARTINASFPDQQVFICDYLNPYAKRIRAETKYLAKLKGYKFVWVKLGLVFIQKDEFHPARSISNNYDLTALRIEPNCTCDPWGR